MNPEYIYIGVWFSMAFVTFGMLIWHEGIEGINDPLAIAAGAVFFWPFMLAAIIGSAIRDRTVDKRREDLLKRVEELEQKLEELNGRRTD